MYEGEKNQETNVLLPSSLNAGGTVFTTDTFVSFKNLQLPPLGGIRFYNSFLSINLMVFTPGVFCCNKSM